MGRTKFHTTSGNQDVLNQLLVSHKNICNLFLQEYDMFHLVKEMKFRLKSIGIDEVTVPNVHKVHKVVTHSHCNYWRIL